MRYTGPRNRIARREGIDLGLKTPGTKAHAMLLKKLNVPPGQHGARGKRKFSERARQLREKQKLRYMFGVTEKILKNYFNDSKRRKGNTGLHIAQHLERRLDNVVFRLGLAPTRASARQLVNHGHVTVNGNKMSIPSYEVRMGDLITFKKELTSKIPYINATIDNKTLLIPSWLEKKAIVGKIVADPSSEDIEKQIHLREVIEFYSK